jgi:CBS domain-containing protein/sporulation protein YlmC with PRC-barrel domain
MKMPTDTTRKSSLAAHTRTSVNLKGALISVAGLIGRPVTHHNGQEVASLADLVFRWDTGQNYPPLSGLIVRVGRRLAWIPASKLSTITQTNLTLNTAVLDLQDFAARPGEVRLTKDVLDHQLVDMNGVRVVRASDLYVTNVSGVVRLVGVDVGYRTLLRRLGPARWRTRPTPDAVIDWAAVRSFGREKGDKQDLRLTSSRSDLRKLRPGELADLLEDLGRSERQELLNTLTTEEAADALEEMESGELTSLLRESAPEEAASLLTEMVSDEAADALRDMDEDMRNELMGRMSKESSRLVRAVLSHKEDSAGGSMNTTVLTSRPGQTVEQLRKHLITLGEEPAELDAVAIVGEAGELLYDIPLAELFIARDDQPLSDFIKGPKPVTVPADLDIEKVAELLIASRHASLLVVNEHDQPIGRILADDVVDALLPEREGFHFPRILP